MSCRRNEGKSNPTISWDVNGCDLDIMGFTALRKNEFWQKKLRSNLLLYLYLKIFGDIIYSSPTLLKLLVPATGGLTHVNGSRKDLTLFIFSWYICISWGYFIIMPQANRTIMAILCRVYGILEKEWGE